MAVYALTCLAGAPGVTTTALAWTALSPRPTLIVEADVTGGSPILAGAFEGTWMHRGGVLALASAEEADWVETIWQQAVTLPGRSDRWVLPTIGRGHQARAMASIWRPLAATLTRISRDTGVDILIDAGRLGVAGGPWDLITGADAVLLLTDSTIPALTTLSVALPSLRADLDQSGSHHRLGVVPLTGPSQLWRSLLPGLAGMFSGHAEPDIRPYSRAEIAATVSPTATIAALPHAPRAAATYAHAMTPCDTRTYDAAITQLIVSAQQHASAYRQLMHPTSTSEEASQ